MDSKHTPIPWKVVGWHISASGGKRILDASTTSSADDLDFACRAVNNHEALLDLTEKLAILAEALEGGESPGIFDWLKIRNEARQAIEAAKE